MTKEELAALLNGRQYRRELTNIEVKEAAENNLVVIFGASDDLVEFVGAINDETGAPGFIYFDPNSSRLPESGCTNDCPYFLRYLNKLPWIEACWCEVEGYSWTCQQISV